MWGRNVLLRKERDIVVVRRRQGLRGIRKEIDEERCLLCFVKENIKEISFGWPIKR
jgi:hypothetical protein